MGQVKEEEYLDRLLPKLEEFLALVDPEKKMFAKEMLDSISNQDELFDMLDREYGEYFMTLEASKPQCRFGKQCYRRNKDHLREFSHPEH